MRSEGLHGPHALNTSLFPETLNRISRGLMGCECSALGNKRILTFFQESSVEGIGDGVGEEEGASEEGGDGGAFAEDEKGSGDGGHGTVGEGHKGRLGGVGEEEHGGGDAEAEGDDLAGAGEEGLPEGAVVGCVDEALEGGVSIWWV